MTVKMFLFSNCFCKSEVQLLSEQLAAQNKVDMFSLESKMKHITTKLDYIINIVETERIKEKES